MTGRRGVVWGMVLGVIVANGGGCRGSAGAGPREPEARDVGGDAGVGAERERERAPELEPARAADGDVAIAERFAWMVGAWVSEADGRRESETWVVEGDTLKGVNETRVGEKVVHSEAIVIERRGEEVVYEARPSSQPAHAFVLVEDGEGRARFEDPAHDWPQVIEYAREGDVLTATVSGAGRTAVWRWTLAR